MQLYEVWENEETVFYSFYNTSLILLLEVIVNARIN